MERPIKPRWREVRHKSEAGESPRQVADYVLRLMGVTVPPVPVLRIAQDLDIELARDPWLDAAGVLESTRASARISYKSSDPPERQRFTVAHEIGHLLLHTIGSGAHFRFHDPSFGPTRVRKESDANEFAASLLMPLWLVEPLATGARRTTRQLADLFEVSHKAMEVQLSKLLSR